jgi:hypothetical protein
MLALEQLAELLEKNRAAAKARVREFAIGGQHFAFNSRPAIMGVINLSADSWYRESVCLTAEAAVRRGKVMREQEADILDSRRIPVNSEERAKRVGDVPYYGAAGQVGFIDKHIFDEELVLLGEDGAPFLDSGKPKAYLIHGKSWVNNHAHVLRGKPGLLNSFLLYQLNNLDYRPYVTTPCNCS